MVHLRASVLAVLLPWLPWDIIIPGYRSSAAVLGESHGTLRLLATGDVDGLVRLQRPDVMRSKDWEQSPGVIGETPVKLGHARPSFHFLPSLFIHSLNLFVTNMTKSSGDDKYRWSDPRPKSGPAYCFWFETYACSAADILWKGRAHLKSPFD